MGNAYTYYSYEEYGRGYIGARSKSPIGDNNYFGSFKDKSFKPTQKIILSEFETMEEALAAEVELHKFFEVDINPHFANKAKQTSSGFYFDSTGTKMSEETKRKIAQSHSGLKLEEQTKEKVGKASRRRWEDPVYREKVLSKRRGSKRSEETKRKMAESRRKFWENKTKEEKSEIAKRGHLTRKAP